MFVSWPSRSYATGKPQPRSRTVFAAWSWPIRIRIPANLTCGNDARTRSTRSKPGRQLAPRVPAKTITDGCLRSSQPFSADARCTSQASVCPGCLVFALMFTSALTAPAASGAANDGITVPGFGPLMPSPAFGSELRPTTTIRIRNAMPTTHEYALDGFGAFRCSSFRSAATSASSPAASRSAALLWGSAPSRRRSPNRSSATGGRARLGRPPHPPWPQVAQREALVLLRPHERCRQDDHDAQQRDRQVDDRNDAEVAQHPDVG